MQVIGPTFDRMTAFPRKAVAVAEPVAPKEISLYRTFAAYFAVGLLVSFIFTMLHFR
jgi:hypothetical protein